MTQFMSIIEDSFKSCIDNYFHKRGVPGSSHPAHSAEVYDPSPSNASTLLSDITGGTFGSTTTQLPYWHKPSLTSPIGIIFDIRARPKDTLKNSMRRIRRIRLSYQTQWRRGRDQLGNGRKRGSPSPPENIRQNFDYLHLKMDGMFSHFRAKPYGVCTDYATNFQI